MWQEDPKRKLVDPFSVKLLRNSLMRFRIYFGYYLCDAGGHANTLPSVKLMTGALFRNLNIHPMLPL